LLYATEREEWGKSQSQLGATRQTVKKEVFAF
jgi:hypothetical protein